MSLWKAILKCSDCGQTLNTAEHVPKDQKGRVAMSSGFAAGSCPRGCRATFSDLNLNTDLEWVEEAGA
ncbi:hypothetical protein LCGC14_0798170 [marine sediment metagenome]|uniref:Uncharacterized protein n=1 Tax=marine sediment metagenome TaxID=412755 RepID=A0A0F9PUY1_9ZZZZ